jgi:hypothetical protein
LLLVSSYLMNEPQVLFCPTQVSCNHFRYHSRRKQLYCLDYKLISDFQKNLKLIRVALILARRRAEPTTPRFTLPWDTTFKVPGVLAISDFVAGRIMLRRMQMLIMMLSRSCSCCRTKAAFSILFCHTMAECGNQVDRIWSPLKHVWEVWWSLGRSLQQRHKWTIMNSCNGGLYDCASLHWKQAGMSLLRFLLSSIWDEQLTTRQVACHCGDLSGEPRKSDSVGVVS